MGPDLEGSAGEDGRGGGTGGFPVESMRDYLESRGKEQAVPDADIKSTGSRGEFGWENRIQKSG